jgi:hypothetical protein
MGGRKYDKRNHSKSDGVVIINEEQMLSMLDNARAAFLLEPPYRRKYLPLGLAKIARYIKQRGFMKDKRTVDYGRFFPGGNFDLICITSLFTYDSRVVLDAIKEVRFLSPHVPILVGGVFATLMSKVIEREFPDVFIFPGYSQVLDRFPPDYSIDWGMEAPWDTFSYLFTSRGCPNHCAYCAVWRIEPVHWINPDWRLHIQDELPNVMISDNNLSACPMEHINAVIDYLAEHKKHVVFDNGLDCKLITPELAAGLSRLKFIRNGMRMAFDRIAEDGVFQKAVETLQKAGVPKSQIFAYILFNFTDTPKEADYRARECVRLGVRPYPQMYTPLHKTDRSSTYIGKHWTPNLAKAFRFFYLMAGYYTKMTFEEFLRSPLNKIVLADKDWEAWK